MCFKILRGAEPWGNRYVYKTVHRIERNKTWRGEWYDFIYGIGDTYSLLPTSKTEEPAWRVDDDYHSHSGFYVYRSLERANFGNFYKAILCLEVNKEDFLHQDYSREIATYRKVRVVGEIRVPRHSRIYPLL